MTINVAVIGFGLSAKVFHLPFIEAINDFNLTAIMTSQYEQAKQAHPHAEIYDQFTTLLCQPDIDLVVITSPNDSHYDLAKQALVAGKHVVVEKPFTTTSRQADELIALANKQNCLLTVYHNRRLDGDFITIQKLINQGALGKVRMLHSRFDRFRPQVRDKWKEQAGEGTGILYDLGSHLIDQALQLFGKPSAITAHCLALRENSSVVDYFDLRLHYPAIQVKLSSSPFNAGVNQRFTVQGDKDSLTITGLDSQEAQIVAGMALDDQQFANNSTQQAELALAGKVDIVDGDYCQFYRQLLVAITKNKAPFVMAKSARDVIALIELAMQSSQQQRTITVPENL